MADFKKLKDGQGNSYNVKDEQARTNLASHTGNTSNPHSVTKAQVGLGNVDNTSDLNKPISNAQAAVNATKFDKANVKATPASTPSNDNVVSEKYSEETYAKKDGYYETFGYAREAGIASNLKNDEGKLLDPDTATSSGTIYADQPFTQRATAMTMNAYLNNELITVGSGYEQWKKEQAFSIVRNQLVVNLVATKTVNGVTFTNNGDGTITLNGTATEDIGTVTVGESLTEDFIVPRRNNKCLVSFGCQDKEGIYFGVTGYAINNKPYFLFQESNDTDWNGNLRCRILNGTTFDNFIIRPTFHNLTQWFASRPEIATALTGDAGIKWFLQNYPQATTLGYDEGTIVDTEDYEYQTTGVNLWDEEWEVGRYDTTDGQKQSLSQHIRCKNKIKVLPNTAFWFRLPQNYDSWVNVLYYDANQEYIGSLESGLYGPAAQSGLANFHNPFTTPNNCMYITFFCGDKYGTTYKHDIQICQHFTETTVEQTYHPYEIYKNRVSWAFTSTGKGKSAGKAADTKDYVNKKNIEKVGRVDLGTLNWVMDYNSGGHQEFRSYDIQVAYNGSNTSKQNILCTSLDSVTPDDAYHGSVTGISVSGNYISVGFTNGSYTDAATFKAAMSGVYLNYELVTYIETDMTGDELDTNIPENDYGVERKVPVSGNMFSGSATTIFYQDNVLRQIYNNKTSIDNLQEEVATKQDMMQDLSSQITDVAGLTYALKKAYKIGNIAFIDIIATNNTGSQINIDDELFNVASGLYYSGINQFFIVRKTGENVVLTMTWEGKAKLQVALNTSDTIHIHISYAVA